MNRFELALLVTNIIFTFTLSNLFVINLTFFAIKRILILVDREKLEEEKA